MKRLSIILILSLVVLVGAITYANIGGIGGAAIDSTITVTKDTTVVAYDTQSLKIVYAASDDETELELVSPVLANGADYWSRLWVFPSAIHNNSKLYLDVDGAGNVLSREVGKSLDDRGNFARAFNLDGTYYLDGGNIHNADVNDFCLSIWVKTSGITTGRLIGKRSAGTLGYDFYLDNGSVPAVLVGDSSGYTASYSTGITVNNGYWHHIVVLCDRDGNTAFYVDGISRGGSAISTRQLSLDHVTSFKIGSYLGVTLLNGQVCDAKIYIGGLWSTAQILYQYNNPFDLGAGAGTITDAWFCNDNAASTTVVSQAGGTNLTASANTSVFAVTNWKMYEQCFTGDQDGAHGVKVRITGAGAGANTSTVYLDNGEIRKNMVANGAMEGGATPPASWVQEASATVISDTSPHSGTNCLKATAGAANKGASQAVTLVSGKYYTITGYAKATAADTARITVDKGDTTTFSAGTVTATSWTKIQASFLSTGTAGVIYLRGVANTDIVWFDDVSLIQVDEAAASTATKGSGYVPVGNPIRVGN